MGQTIRQNQFDTVQGQSEVKPVVSGQRIQNGLYQTNTGKTIN